MAQSDYIKHLKLATEIKQQKELTPVLSSKKCQQTNTRPNRVPLKAVYITPRPIPLYVKQRANTSCSACCYDTSINGPNNKKFNFFNTNFTTFANYRMRKMACNCKTL